jgi:hypothetical protein
VQGECEENEGDGQMHMTLRLASVMFLKYLLFASLIRDKEVGRAKIKEKGTGYLHLSWSVFFR